MRNDASNQNHAALHGPRVTVRSAGRRQPLHVVESPAYRRSVRPNPGYGRPPRAVASVSAPRVGPPGTGSPSLPARSAPSSAGRNGGPAAVGTMGAGLRRCGRDKRGEVVPDRSLAIPDIDGLYRKIVFDCAKRVSGLPRERCYVVV